MYLSEPAGPTALGRDIHLELLFIHSGTINKLSQCAQHCSREGNQGKEASKAKIPTLTHFTFLWEEMGLHSYGRRWASLVAWFLKNLPAVQETLILTLGWEDPLGEGMATHSSILVWRIPMDRGAWRATVHGGVAKSGSRVSD